MAAAPNPWNEIFRREGKVFVQPHDAMPDLLRVLQRQATPRVLDLGCGNGRHVVYLARHGGQVVGLDSAPEALALTRTWLAQEGLAAELRLHSMTEPLPYPPEFFDAVLAMQGIHPAALATIRELVGEMGRVLKRQGVVCVTVSTPKANPRWQHAIETEPGTYLPLDGREHGLLHHQFTPDELRELFTAFHVRELRRDSTPAPLPVGGQALTPVPTRQGPYPTHALTQAPTAAAAPPIAPEPPSGH